MLPPPHFVAVDDQVIRLGPHLRRLALQHGQILVARGRERMMVGRPALLLVVPDERRKIDDPGDLEIVGSAGVDSSFELSAAPGASRRCAAELWQTTSSLSATNSSRSPASAFSRSRSACCTSARQELLDAAGELVRLDLDPGQPLGAERPDELAVRLSRSLRETSRPLPGTFSPRTFPPAATASLKTLKRRLCGEVAQLRRSPDRSAGPAYRCRTSA